MEPPTAPASAARGIASAASSGAGPCPFSRSTETGRSVARSSACVCSITSSSVAAPSGRPSVNAKPELVLASALKPSAARTLAEPASQGFGMTKVSPSWSERKSAPFCSGGRVNGGGLQDRREQTGEACLEVVAAEAVEAGRALLPLLDDAGLSEDLEVVGAGGLRDRHVEAAAGWRVVGAGQVGHDLEAHGVAQRVEHRAQLDLLPRRVSDLLRCLGGCDHHVTIVRRSSNLC